MEEVIIGLHDLGNEWCCPRCGSQFENELVKPEYNVDEIKTVHFLPDKYGAVIGTPSSGRITTDTMSAVTRDLKTGVLKNFLVGKGPYIHRNRNGITRAFLESWTDKEANKLVMTDDDIWWDTGVLEVMFKMMEHCPVVFADLHLADRPTTAHHKLPDGSWDALWPHPIKGKGAFHCPGMASALCVMDRQLLIDMNKKFECGWWDLLYDDQPDGGQCGEDISFSIRLGKMGIEPLCIKGLTIVHHRQMPVLAPELVEERIKELLDGKAHP